jgi:hypothetical protein
VVGPFWSKLVGDASKWDQRKMGELMELVSEELLQVVGTKPLFPFSFTPLDD